MKLFKIFSGLVVLILILIFLLKNTEEVAIDLIFMRYSQVKIAFVMVGALAVGILIGYGVAVISIISAKSEIRSFKLKNRRLSDELNDLRNVAIDEGIYPSTFYMATGFHGAHVIIGTIFLIVCFFRGLKGHFKPEKHLGFEFAAWYWHFVDVIWLFLFTFVYWWASV